jgi:predicted nuclease with TOPRIM domain
MLTQILKSLRRIRTAIAETWRSRHRVRELEEELHLMKLVLQRLVEEVRRLKEELEELQAWTQAEHEKIRLRLEQLEQGLPAEKPAEADKDDGWIM